MLVFSTPNAFFRQAKIGLIQALEKIVTQTSNEDHVCIKILTPTDNRINDIIQRVYALNDLNSDVRQEEYQHQHQKEQDNKITFNSDL